MREEVYMVTEMMERRLIDESAYPVYDLDEYRRGLPDRPNERAITASRDHKVDLWTLLAGQAMPLHRHTKSECIMVVISGEGEYRLGDRKYDIKEGMLATAPPDTPHGLTNTNSEPLVVLTVAGPGPFDLKILEPESIGKFY